MPAHEEAVKFMIKARISFIQANIDRKPVMATIEALAHLLADLNAYERGLTEG